MKGNPEFFDRRVPDHAVDVAFEFFALYKAVIRQGEVDDVVPLQRVGHGLQLLGAVSVGIEASHQTSHAGSDDHVDRHFLRLQDPEHAHMSESPDGAGPQHDCNLRRFVRRRDRFRRTGREQACRENSAEYQPYGCPAAYHIRSQDRPTDLPYIRKDPDVNFFRRPVAAAAVQTGRHMLCSKKRESQSIPHFSMTAERRERG